jgi:DNA invertase Pin-like site-specific DNA recombinase|tara:strand:+ start:452 stop:1060 length:609 start_codon:yes stop_codon:yes gene_type:complete
MSYKKKIEKMLVGYARVSTQEQNLELQINALKEVGCKKIFMEKASGAQRDRPELKAALEYMRANEDDTLVVWKLDRLARSLRKLIDTVEELEKQGIGFKSLTEAIDTTNSGGRLVFHIFGALAEFERGVIKERTMAGLKAAKDMGRTGGRPASLKIDDLIVAKALLKNKKITVKEAAKRLKVNPSTLYRYLPGGRSAIEEET